MGYPETLFESLDAGTIQRFVAEAQEEHLHLEFKTSDERWQRDDRKNLARSLSGFGNADGGVIVWGVGTVPSASGAADCASTISPIRSLAQFVARLNEFTGAAVNPLIDGVLHRRIESGPDIGFVVTLVPASDSGPYMAKLGEDRYYKRSGSRFAKMEHYEVADMFGRRRRPVLELAHRIRKLGVGTEIGTIIELTLTLSNSGRGSASAPLLDIDYSAGYHLNVARGIASGPSGSLIKPIILGPTRFRIVGYADFVIHPGVAYDLARLTNTSPIEDRLILTCQVAAQNLPIQTISLTVEPEEMYAAES